MSVLASDSFNRADGDVGADWTITYTGSAGWNVSSNQAKPSNFGIDCIVYNNTAAWPANHYSKIVFKSATGSQSDAGGGVAIRLGVGGSRNLYWFVSSAGGTSSYLGKFVAGTYTRLGSDTTAWASGDEQYLEAQGSAIVCKHAGATVISTTDSSVSSGRAGLAYSSTISNWLGDDWEGGDFSGGATVIALTAAAVAFAAQPAQPQQFLGLTSGLFNLVGEAASQHLFATLSAPAFAAAATALLLTCAVALTRPLFRFLAQAVVVSGAIAAAAPPFVQFLCEYFLEGARHDPTPRNHER